MNYILLLTYISNVHCNQSLVCWRIHCCTCKAKADYYCNTAVDKSLKYYPPAGLMLVGFYVGRVCSMFHYCFVVENLSKFKNGVKQTFLL